MSSVTVCGTECVCDMAWSGILSSRRAGFGCPAAKVSKGARTEAQVTGGNIGAISYGGYVVGCKVLVVFVKGQRPPVQGKVLGLLPRSWSHALRQMALAPTPAAWLY